MAQNPNGAQECSIEVFGSWVTETAPANLPIGVSPDCPDNVFAPGQVGTRPALEKIFNPPLEPNATITYAKSFVTPAGGIKNLYLSSLGNFYVEDVVAAPGVAVLLFTTTPGTYAKSVTAFGREYIAISDGLHGQEAPLQYDGTFVDRVTADGPGTPPTVQSIAYPAVALAVAGAGTVYTVTSSTPTVHNPFTGLWQLLNVVFTVAPAVAPGDQMILTGSTAPNANGTFTVFSVAGTAVAFYYNQPNPTAGTGGSGVIFPGGGSTLTRQGNTVTGTTVLPHNLRVGYQALIAGVATSQVGGGITSLVIDNEDLAGIATITTAALHGLQPQNQVSLANIAAVVVGGTIIASGEVPGQLTFTTSAPHGLKVGSVINVTGTVAPQKGDGQWTVTIVPDPFTFGFPSADATTTHFGGNSGTVSLVFPNLGLNEAIFEVISAPTPTSFQVALEYSDGTWTSGTVSFAWNGTFYVTAVPSATTFAYQQYGPNAATGSPGSLTPYGQAAPGLHQLQISFLDRQGGITRPSPPVLFVANGGQYVAVSDLAIGPPTTVARILEVTGALGSTFFYLPVAPQVNGLVVGTATQIGDNVTTSVVLDFSDNSLFAGIGTSIPGNNLAAQIVLDGALNFLFSSSRLGTFGQRNCIQNLLNMGFDGGYVPAAPTAPTGWTSTAAGGALGAGRFNGFNWQIDTGTGPGTLSQGFYEDAYGAPIAQPNTVYKMRYYLTGAGTFRAAISSASTGFTATATIVFAATGWYEAQFTAATPAAIPPDLLYTISGITGVLTVDEGSVIYVQTPYLDTILYDSYVNNPEGFDGLSGKYGPSEDTHKVMAAGIVRGNLCLLTRDPSGRLHEVIDNGTTEPAGWTVNELAANCGILSAFALCQSQADDSSSSGGEEWMAWASESGARIFGGADQWKISQEIQPNWFDPGNPAQVGAGQINMAAALTAWALNDPVDRTIYFGLPLGAATAPSQVYPVNYREMDDAYTIAHSPPFHPSLGGKLIATDNTRKWCYWQRAFNGAARMYRAADELTTCFFAGTGLTPGVGGYGNVYLLNPAMSTDDDYGQIGSYYVTCALPTHEQEQGLQLGSQKKILAALNAYFTCVGTVTFTIYRNGLAYPWPITFSRPSATYFDMEMPGGNPEANRMFFKVQPVPLAFGQPGYSNGTDNRYQLLRLVPFFRRAKVPARGSAT